MINFLTKMFSRFKKCNCCGKSWKTMEQFVADESLRLIGYEANLGALDLGLLLFDHKCGTTLAVKAGNFKDLYNGPVYKERKTGGQECPGYCLHKNELRPCPAKCECGWVREVMQMLKQKGKNRDGSN